MESTNFCHGDIVYMEGFGEGVIIETDNILYISFNNYGNQPYKLEMFDLEDIYLIRNKLEKSY